MLKKLTPLLQNGYQKRCVFHLLWSTELRLQLMSRDILNFAEEHGVYDPALVVHEEFFQWVIEDKFSLAKPKFELAGSPDGFKC